jgi:hypothetical protein
MRPRGPSRTSRPAPTTLEGPEVDVRAFDQTEDGLGVLEQHLTRFGESDRAAALRPLDQTMADPAFEDRDLLADRGLGEAEPRGRRAEGTLPGDGAQRCQMAQLDAGPRAECTNLPRDVVLRPGGQPPFCFPPAWVCAISKEPATIRG